MRQLGMAALLWVWCASLPADGGLRFTPGEMPWKAGPATLPAGAEIAVLEGDPRGSGLFTMRVRLPAGSRLEPHWHPKPERVTVISGTAAIGLGTVFDDAKLHRFPAGSYYLTPPTVPHFALFAEETVLQVTTQGPWELHRLPTPP